MSEGTANQPLGKRKRALPEPSEASYAPPLQRKHSRGGTGASAKQENVVPERSTNKRKINDAVQEQSMSRPPEAYISKMQREDTKATEDILQHLETIQPPAKKQKIMEDNTDQIPSKPSRKDNLSKPQSQEDGTNVDDIAASRLEKALELAFMEQASKRNGNKKLKTKLIAKKLTSRAAQQPKVAKPTITKVSKQRSRSKSTRKPRSSKKQGASDYDEDEDEDEEDTGVGKQPTLWGFLRGQELQTRASFFKTSAVGQRKRGYRDDDDDEFPHDSDYKDQYVGYGRGSDETEDLYVEYMRKKKKKDDAFDEACVYDYASLPKAGVKYTIPGYKVKSKAKKPETITAQQDHEKAAWKALNTFVGTQVTSSASGEYIEWSKACAAFFADSKGGEDDSKPKPKPISFPAIHHKECGVGSRDCLKAEKLRICQHDVLRLLKGAAVQVEGEQWVERLKRERLRWHPDKFSGKMGRQWEGEAKEMFQMVQVLLEREEK